MLVKLVKKHKNVTLDRLTYVFGILLPIATIPQAYAILIEKDTAGVSMITWLFYLASSTLFAIFGIVHKQKLLIITYVPFTIIELLIVVGLILY